MVSKQHVKKNLADNMNTIRTGKTGSNFYVLTSCGTTMTVLQAARTQSCSVKGLLARPRG